MVRKRVRKRRRNQPPPPPTLRRKTDGGAGCKEILSPDQSIRHAAIHERSASSPVVPPPLVRRRRLGRVRDHHALPVTRNVPPAKVVGGVQRREESRELQIGVHGKEALAEVLRAFDVLQDAREEGVRVRGRTRALPPGSGTLGLLAAAVAVLRLLVAVAGRSSGRGGGRRTAPRRRRRRRRSPPVVRIRVQLGTETVVVHHDLVHAEHRRGAGDLPGELGLQFSSLRVRHDASGHGYRHRRTTPRGIGGMRLEFRGVGHDATEAMTIAVSAAADAAGAMLAVAGGGVVVGVRWIAAAAASTAAAAAAATFGIIAGIAAAASAATATSTADTGTTPAPVGIIAFSLRRVHNLLKVVDVVELSYSTKAPLLRSFLRSFLLHSSFVQVFVFSIGKEVILAMVVMVDDDDRWCGAREMRKATGGSCPASLRVQK